MEHLLQEIFNEIDSRPAAAGATAAAPCDCPKCSAINAKKDCYPPVSDLPKNPLGSIFYKGTSFYQFTPEDALWFGKLLIGEAGGSDDIGGHAVLWTMINRFTLFKRVVPAWKTFSDFIKLYSTPLQCPLNNAGAMARVWKARDKSQILCTGGTTRYNGESFPKVMYKRHYDTQKEGWTTLPKGVQAIVIRMLTGQILNPGIGLASEFANTKTYYIQRYKKVPSPAEWKAYTLRIFLKAFKGGAYAWIGPRPGLDQFNGNIFFIKRTYLKTDPNIIEIKI